MNNSTGWTNTVLEKQNELDHIADWDGIVRLDGVRDACRTASYLLDQELERCEEITNEPRLHQAPRTTQRH